MTEKLQDVADAINWETTIDNETGGSAVMDLTIEFHDVTPEQIEALAQFVKRLHYSDIEGCAVDKGEADVMVQAVEKLQAGLARKGYAPR